MRTVTLSPRAWLVLASVSLFACQGQIGDDKSIGGIPGSTPVNGNNGPGTGSGSTPGAGVFVTDPSGVTVNGFALPLEQPQLLPFAVRFARVAAVVGLPTTDAVFEQLRQNRTQLGDHDYANGVKADNSWTALRMSVWVKSLQPVCASPAMTKKFAALPANLDAFVEAAYGRSLVAQDTADVQASLQGITLTATQRYQTMCLALLSSMEFLTQ